MQYKCKYTCTYIAVFFHSDCIQHIPRESCKRELPKYIDISFLELKYLKHYISLYIWKVCTQQLESLESSLFQYWFTWFTMGKNTAGACTTSAASAPQRDHHGEEGHRGASQEGTEIVFFAPDLLENHVKIMGPRLIENHGTEINRTFMGKYG